MATGGARPLAMALGGVVLVALLLLYGPPLVAGWVTGQSAARAECTFTLAIFGPILALGLAGRWLAGGGGRIAGDRPATAAARGAAFGLGGLLLATGYAWIAGTAHHAAGSAIGASILLGLLTIAIQVGAEEMLFRGWLQPVIAARIGIPAAIAVTASVFALLHLAGGAAGVIPLLNLLLGGILFGLLAARDRGIAGAFAAHFAWNGAEQLLLGLDPNPGVGAFGTLLDLDMSGATLWGGADQGLNASLAMTVALAALVVPLLVRQHSGSHSSPR